MAVDRRSKQSIGWKIFKCFTDSEKLFNSVKNESLSDTMIYYSIMAFVFLLMNSLVFFLSGSFLLLDIISFFGPFAEFSFALIFVTLFLLLLLLNIALASVYHVFVKLLGGKSNFNATFKAISYGFTPAALLGWIPFLGFLISIHYFYLNVKGIGILHKVSMHRAFWALLLPVIITLVLISVFLAAFLVQIISLIENSAVFYQ